MAGFAYRKNIDGSSDTPTLRQVIAKNSITFTVGDMVRINTSGFGDIVDADEDISGVLAGVVDQNGAPLSPDSGTLDTYSMGASNQTDATLQYKLAYIPALPHYLFYNDADGDIAEIEVLQNFDLITSDQVQASSAADTQKQVQLVEFDPDGDSDASKGLFRVVETHYGTVAAYRAA